MKVVLIISGAVVLAALGAIAWGAFVSNVEQGRYEVVESHGTVEIRDYAPMIVAEVRVSGEREDAISDGFGLLADYIFGNNRSSEKVAMTAPVIQAPGEKIAMTTPVTQQGGDGFWWVRFMMPSRYTMETLPQPENSSVLLKEIPAKRFAAIRFSGRPTRESLEAHARELEAFVREQNLQSLSEPAYAFFNPPWTLPPLRRNEVMIEIESKTSSS